MTLQQGTLFIPLTINMIKNKTQIIDYEVFDHTSHDYSS